MRYGFIIPGGDIRTLPDIAVAAEEAGWDGVFIPDAIAIETPEIPPIPGFDPWVVLGAMAARTNRVRLGTMLTALPRRRPWKLAREVATLDHLSSGRAIIAVGTGAAADDGGFVKVGEPMDRKTRTALLDEGLRIMTGLWSGQPFSFTGEHYHIDAMTQLPPPMQQPHIPVWVVGVWPSVPSMGRALRYDGVLPLVAGADGTFGRATPEQVRAMRDYAEEQRTETTPFDIVVEGTTPGDDIAKATAEIQPYVEAGATWWMEAMWTEPNGLNEILNRIKQGPPKES